MEIALTISAVIGLVNTLIRVFRNISKWLKARDPLFKENSRMIKILKAHFDHNNNPNEQLPAHISVLYRTLRERKRDWRDTPGAIEAEREAEEIGRYQEVGYTTDYDPSDLSDEEVGSPDDALDDSPDDSSDEDEDDDSPDDDDSPVYSSPEDSTDSSSDDDDEYDSD